jgi:type 1 glutamine amidotransferase
MKSVASMAAAFAASSAIPLGWTRAADDADKPRKVLFFTQSAGFEHSCIKRAKPDQLSHAEKVLVELGKQHNFDVTATKDGGVFTPEQLARFDVIAFYTTGHLEQPGGKDGNPPMPKGGKDALLKFIESGKGFVGFHCATDTFGQHAHFGNGADADPYIKMVGGEFDGHGKQQPAKIRAVTAPGFAPLKDAAKDFELHEEWYAFRNLAPDMQVLLAQDTAGLAEEMYTKRKPYPMTWARKQGGGRVFYTSMGHREDVWTNPLFQNVVLGGLAWAAGNVQAEVKPNLMEACPGVEKVRPA